jgi:flagellar biosynthesis/type III secretory pathway protein FliH
MSHETQKPFSPPQMDIRKAVFMDVESNEEHRPSTEGRVIFDAPAADVIPWSPIQLSMDGTPVPPPPTTAQLLAQAREQGLLEEPATNVESCEGCEQTRQQAETDKASIINQLQEPYTRGAQKIAEAAFELSQRTHLEIVDLAVQLAEQIAGHAIAMDTDYLKENLHQALLAAGPLQTASILCHPDDRKAMINHAPAMAEKIAGRLVELEFIASDDVNAGGCVIRFEQGSVDARLATQMDRLKEVVREAILQNGALGQEETTVEIEEPAASTSDEPTTEEQ